MMKNMIHKLFKLGDIELEFEATVFGDRRNNMSIVLGSDRELDPLDTAFVLGFMLVEICNDCGLDLHEVLQDVYQQNLETNEDLN